MNLTLLAFIFTLPLAYALYEDQAGLNDWHRPHIGRVSDAVFGNKKELFVVTDAGIVASLNSRTGSIVWRQELLHGDSSCSVKLFSGGALITMCTEHMYAWHAGTGSLVWDTVVSGVRGVVEHDGACVLLDNTGATAYEMTSGTKKWHADLDFDQIAVHDGEIVLIGKSGRAVLDNGVLSKHQDGIAGTLHNGDVFAWKYPNIVHWAPDGKARSIKVDDVPRDARVSVVGDGMVVLSDGDRVWVYNLAKSVVVHHGKASIVSVYSSHVILVSNNAAVIVNKDDVKTVDLPNTHADHGNILHAYLHVGNTWRCLVITASHSVALVKSTGIVWMREEGIATADHAVIIDLPSDVEARDDEATHGEFGFSQLAVLLSSSAGKIFALHTSNGDIVWSHHVGKCQFVSAYGVRLGGSESRLSLVVAGKTDKGTFIMAIEPSTGAVLDSWNRGGRVKHVAPLHQHGPLLVVMESGTVLVYPASDWLDVHHNSTFIHSVDDGVVRGYGITGSKMTEAWTVRLPQGKVVVAQHNALDRVSSPVRVLPNRAVLPKYLNPHAIALAVLDSKHVMTMMVIDTVSGAVLLHSQYSGIRGPIHAVKSENTFIVHYYSLTRKIDEMVVVELVQESVGDGDEFSSWSSQLPTSVGQVFGIPVSIECMTTTVTAHGITPKNLIIGVKGGQVMMIHRALIDPRRPFPDAKDQSPIPPYTPLLPALSQSVISYHTHVMGVRHIVTAPTVLESTSLVLAYGIDVFYTRVTPAGAFDMLNHDFNHPMLLLSLAALAILTPVVAWLARRKEIARLWK